MRLSEPPRRELGESVAPMINVVFLLLIFFLMAATLRSPEALEAAPPLSDAETPAEAAPTLVIAADGRVAHREVEGLEPALAALSASSPEEVALRADARAPAKLIASLTRRLRAAGVARVRLLTRPKGGA